MPLWIVPVDGDFLWTWQSKVPAKQPAFYKHIRSEIIMDVQFSPVLRVEVGQCDCSWVMYWDCSKDILLNGHRQNGIAAVIDVLSW